ncbi:MAG: hypothetical protein K2J47_03435, partial [Ruminococcus sp.]|nr:hypothetical protein [Ruminococcus sp.]
IMKNITKKIIAVFAVLCVAMASMTSCADKPKDSSSSSNAENKVAKQYPLSIGGADDDNLFANGDLDIDLDGDDPVAVTTKAGSDDAKTTTAAKDDTVPVTKIQEVTDANNQPVTKIVEVTNANGEKQTDANNQTVTEVVKVTEVVTVPSEENAGNTETSTEAPKSDYKAKNDGRYAMWLDCSKNENFFFEDEMLKIKFKVKEGIPDGDYKIRISPELSDIDAVSVKPAKVMDGIIRVNNGEIEAVDVSNETGDYMFYGDNIACKQGDTIDFNINIKNNKGLVAFCIWFYFDSNALEFVEAGATGEYEEIARGTEIGSGNVK